MTITNTIAISGHYYVTYPMMQNGYSYPVTVYKNDVQIDAFVTAVPDSDYIGVLQKEYDFEAGDVIKMTRTNVNVILVPTYVVI